MVFLYFNVIVGDDKVGFLVGFVFLKYIEKKFLFFIYFSVGFVLVCF